MTNAEARFNIALRPRKPEGSLGRTAQDGHLDSHTAPELWTRGAQRTSFNTLDNWGHKTPTQSKRKRRGKKKIKGSWPETQYTRLHFFSFFSELLGDVFFGSFLHVKNVRCKPELLVCFLSSWRCTVIPESGFTVWSYDVYSPKMKSAN